MSHRNTKAKMPLNVPNFQDRHVVGTCPLMCPQKEIELREREGLLHKFERLDESSSTTFQNPPPIVLTSSSQPRLHFSNRQNGKYRRNLPKADSLKTVKSFSRSAAGLDKTHAQDLRPPQVLLQTVYYLCRRVLTRMDEPFTVIYDFMFDRLRSVRQDLVIQRICDLNAIRILETIVNFHAYAAYRCRDESIQTFDPHINKRHLIDCLKRLICLYELNDYWESSRNEFESLYLIICPDSSEVLSRALSIRPFIEDKTFDLAVEMSLAYQLKNYVRYYRRIRDLPPLLEAYVFQHTIHMRRMAYQILSTAYGSKACKFPVKLLAKILLYGSSDDVETNLCQINVEIIEGDKGERFARFIKTDNSIQVDRLEAAELQMKYKNVLVPDNMEFIAKEIICTWRDVRLPS